jgi:hypothetical protein
MKHRIAISKKGAKAMATALQKHELEALDTKRYFGVGVSSKAKENAPSETYEVYFDLEYSIDMSVIQWDENPAFGEFVKGAYPSHIVVVCDTLTSTPEMLHIELKSGYASYVATRHTFKSHTAKIDVALVSEMGECKGSVSIWRTAVMTVTEHNEWVKKHKDLPN